MRRLSPSFFLFLIATSSIAEQTPAASGDVLYPPRLEILSNHEREMLKRSPTGMLDRFLTLFFQEAENGVLSRDVLERRRDVRLAQYRAIALRDIMSFNLDTDPQITAEEIEKQQDILEAKRRARLVTLLYEFDRDRDGGVANSVRSDLVK